MRASSCGSWSCWFRCMPVHLLQQIELFALIGRRQIAVLHVAQDLLRIGLAVVDVRALIDARQEAVAPQLRADDRLAGAERHEAGQVLVVGAQPVGDPGAERGADRLHIAGVHHQQRRLVVRVVGPHRAHDADIVDAASDFGIQFGDLDAALAIPRRI